MQDPMPGRTRDPMQGLTPGQTRVPMPGPTEGLAAARTAASPTEAALWTRGRCARQPVRPPTTATPGPAPMAATPARTPGRGRLPRSDSAASDGGVYITSFSAAIAALYGLGSDGQIYVANHGELSPLGAAPDGGFRCLALSGVSNPVYGATGAAAVELLALCAGGPDAGSRPYLWSGAAWQSLGDLESGLSTGAGSIAGDLCFNPDAGAAAVISGAGAIESTDLSGASGWQVSDAGDGFLLLAGNAASGLRQLSGTIESNITGDFVAPGPGPRRRAGLLVRERPRERRRWLRALDPTDRPQIRGSARRGRRSLRRIALPLWRRLFARDVPAAARERLSLWLPGDRLPADVRVGPAGGTSGDRLRLRPELRKHRAVGRDQRRGLRLHRLLYQPPGHVCTGPHQPGHDAHELHRHRGRPRCGDRVRERRFRRR